MPSGSSWSRTARWATCDGRVRPPGGETAITLVTWFPTMPPGSVKGTVIESDDLEVDIACLTDRGVRIQGDIKQAPWGRHVTIDDPDGNGLIVQTTASVS